MADREVRARQFQACTAISVICGACITVHEVRARQFGARMAACEVRHLRFDGDASGRTWPEGDACIRTDMP